MKPYSKQVPHFSNVKKAFFPKVPELGQLRYHVKTARKMRTFFTRRLEPKTRSSFHIEWLPSKNAK